MNFILKMFKFVKYIIKIVSRLFNSMTVFSFIFSSSTIDLTHSQPNQLPLNPLEYPYSSASTHLHMIACRLSDSTRVLPLSLLVPGTHMKQIRFIWPARKQINKDSQKSNSNKDNRNKTTKYKGNENKIKKKQKKTKQVNDIKINIKGSKARVVSHKTNWHFYYYDKKSGYHTLHICTCVNVCECVHVCVCVCVCVHLCF